MAARRGRHARDARRLGPPARARAPVAGADTSWIVPGRAAWSWWADSSSPRRLADQLRHVDAAAAAGWEYVLVDEGWDAAWIPELVAYAAQRGVRILLWADWEDLATRRERVAFLDRLAGWGVAGVKLDFLESDRAARMRFMAAAARAAARRRLVVAFHGVTVPRGFQRTWPNALTFEGVLGAEHAKSGEPIDPAHDVDLVFTRNAIGSMDYTPAALSARGQRSTMAHRLAQAIAFESGLQHYADRPESYAAHPAALAPARGGPGGVGRHAAAGRRAGHLRDRRAAGGGGVVRGRALGHAGAHRGAPRSPSSRRAGATPRR